MDGKFRLFPIKGYDCVNFKFHSFPHIWGECIGFKSKYYQDCKFKNNPFDCEKFKMAKQLELIEVDESEAE